KSRAPADAAVSAGHVHYGGAGLGGFEAIRLRDHVGDLVTTPTVSLDADVIFVNEAFVDNGLNGGQNALQRIATRIAGFVNDVRHENQVTVAEIVRRVDRSARAGIAKLMKALRQALVDINDHRVLLLRIEVIRLEQQSFE